MPRRQAPGRTCYAAEVCASVKKPPTDIRTLGELRASGYAVDSVKDELRRNLMRKLRSGEEVFPGIIGFDRTVIPQLQNAILGRHDIILLGLRGQAKSRLIRMIPNLLDEFVPIVAGSEINDNPFAPVSKFARDRVATMRSDTPVDWLHRSERYGEKLATPDTAIADLIGDIDPIKAAHNRLTYADEEVIHYGIIPRTNRGIFAINELPDLQARIQVGLLNILEEQDIQIRGFNIRFPLDVMMVFSANPEDYTNRGNIITPLKDRLDSQILTHYPTSIDEGILITQQEAWQQRCDSSPQVTVPRVFREIVEQIAFEARQSEYVDQKSGVSARMTRAALEVLISTAERRALLSGDARTTARISDLLHVEAAITGKVELVYEGEREGAQNVARLLTGRAVKTIFCRYFPDPSQKGEGRSAYSAILGWFAAGNAVTIDPDTPNQRYRETLGAVKGLRSLVKRHVPAASGGEKASMMEFVLDALHQHSLLGKELSLGDTALYSDLVGSVLSSLDAGETEDP